VINESVLPVFGIGYENRSDQGFLFRATGYIAYADKTLKPWGGVSLGYAFWSFFSPGLHYQFNGDRRIALSLAPISYVGKSGLACALQVFPMDSGRTGGLFGVSIGTHFF
jgi:hypothetical protein